MATTLDRGLEHDQPVQLQIAGARRRGILDRVLLYIALIAIALFFIFPLIVVVSASLKYRAEVFQDVGIIPADPGLENYQALFSGAASFGLWFRNSAIVSIVGTTLTLIITSLSAYAFARIDFRFKGFLFGLLITTLVLPSVMFLVPQYKLIATIGLYDSLPALVLPDSPGCSASSLCASSS
jgi:multiple sugar transport system permease protein